VSEADPHLSEIRAAMLDAGLDLTWEIHLPPLPEGEGWNSLEAQARDAV
jgi:hypothetical protein